jgi:aromatic ring-opening dioxygenase catalytic subunit (LigB family)
MEIVGAFACSHAGLFVGRRDLAPVAQRETVYGAYRAMGDAIRALAPDAIVLIATDHARVYPLTCVPQYVIGVGTSAEGIGDAQVPACTVPVHQAFAQAILSGMLARDVDLAFSEAMKIDHSFVVPLVLAFDGSSPPIVPIYQNCNVPPLPSLARSHSVGRALRDALLAGPAGRVVVIGTGGLSHWVGSEAEQSFMRRSAGTRIGETATLTLPDVGPVNSAFDRAFLDQICAGRARDFIAEWTPERVYDEAGNGAQELRNWLLVAGAVEDAPAEVLLYEAVSEWLTGTAIVRFT